MGNRGAIENGGSEKEQVLLEGLREGDERKTKKN